MTYSLIGIKSRLISYLEGVKWLWKLLKLRKAWWDKQYSRATCSRLWIHYDENKRCSNLTARYDSLNRLGVLSRHDRMIRSSKEKERYNDASFAYNLNRDLVLVGAARVRFAKIARITWQKTENTNCAGGLWKSSRYRDARGLNPRLYCALSRVDFACTAVCKWQIYLGTRADENFAWTVATQVRRTWSTSSLHESDRYTKVSIVLRSRETGNSWPPFSPLLICPLAHSCTKNTSNNQ